VESAGLPVPPDRVDCVLGSMPDDVLENLVGDHRGKFPSQAHSPGDAIPLGQQLQQRGRFVGQSKILANDKLTQGDR